MENEKKVININFSRLKIDQFIPDESTPVIKQICLIPTPKPKTKNEVKRPQSQIQGEYYKTFSIEDFSNKKPKIDKNEKQAKIVEFQKPFQIV